MSKEIEAKYIADVSPKDMAFALGTYDADREAFPVTFGETAVQVPVSIGEAQSFKEHWNEVEKTPRYQIADDQLSLAGIDFALMGKMYSGALGRQD